MLCLNIIDKLGESGYVAQEPVIISANLSKKCLMQRYAAVYVNNKLARVF